MSDGANGSRIADLFADLSLRTTRFSEGLTRAVIESRRAGADISRALGQNTAAINGVGTAAANAGKEIRNTGDSVGGYVKSVSRIITGILISQAFYSVIRSVKDATASVAEFTMYMEQAEISFTLMLGSAQRATGMLNALQDFAAKTPFRMEDAAQSARRLMAMGFAAENVIPIMRSLADAAAISGSMDPRLIDRMVTALGQMKTKGKVATQELMQLSEAGLPSFKILQEELGLTQDQLSNIGNLHISADVAIPALLRGIEKRYKGAADEISHSTAGLISNIKDDLLFLGSSSITGPAEKFRDLLQGVADKLEATRANMRKSGAGGLIENLFPPGSQGMVRVIGASLLSIGSSVKRLLASFGPAAGALGRLFGNILGIILPIVAAIARVITEITYSAGHARGPLKALAAGFVGLLVAGVATSAVMHLAWVIRLLGISTAIAKAVALLSKAISVLYLTLAKNPIVGVIMIIAAALLALAMSSKVVSAWLDRVMNQLSGLLTGQSALASGTDGTNQAMDDFNQSLVDAADNLGSAGDEAAAAGKQIQDSFIASFDEVHQIPEALDAASNGLLNFVLPELPSISTPALSLDAPTTSGEEEEDNGDTWGIPAKREMPRITWASPPIDPPPPGVVAALATVALVIREFVENAKKNLQTWGVATGTAIAEGVSVLGQWVAEGAKSFGQWTSNGVKQVKEWAAETGESINDWASSTGRSLQTGYATFIIITQTQLEIMRANWNSWVTGVKALVSGWATSVLETFAGWGSEIQTFLLDTLASLQLFWKNHAALILTIVAGLIAGIILWFATIPAAIGTVLATLFLVVVAGFVDVKEAAAAEVGETRERVVTGWQSIKDRIGEIAEGLKLRVTTTFTSMKEGVRGAMNSIIDMINTFINKFNSIRLTIPEVSLPGGGTIGGYSIGVPQIANIPHLKAGGIITRDQIYRGGEGNKPEAVIPLTGESAKPFANMIAQQIAAGLGSSGGSVTYEIGVLVADSLGLKELERRLSAVRNSEQQRKFGQSAIVRGV